MEIHFLWTSLGGEELLSSSEIIPGISYIEFSSLSSSNAGNYSVTATNAIGSGSGEFSLVVLCEYACFFFLWQHNDQCKLHLSHINISSRYFFQLPLVVGIPPHCAGAAAVLLHPVGSALALLLLVPS